MTTSKDVPGFVANALLMPYINEVSCALIEFIFDIVNFKRLYPSSSFDYGARTCSIVTDF